MIVYLCRYEPGKVNERFTRYAKTLWTINVADYVEFMNSRNSKYYRKLAPEDFDGSIEDIKEHFGSGEEILITSLRTSISKEVDGIEYTADTAVHVPMTRYEYAIITAYKNGLAKTYAEANDVCTRAYELASPKLKKALEIYNFDSYMSGFFPDWYDVDVLQIFLEHYGHLLKEEND